MWKRTLLLFLSLVCCPVFFAQEKPWPPDPIEFVPVFSGWDGGRALYGNWRPESDRLIQDDVSSRRAVYRIPFTQDPADYRFTFTLRARGGGWIGGGLHIMATKEGERSGYGYGASWLVWLTRDTAYYRNESTYLQLYRSFSDDLMIQVASISLPEKMEDGLLVDVLYNAAMEILSLSVNGDLKLFFPVKRDQAVGTEVAFRALGGPVEFRSLEISRPTP